MTRKKGMPWHPFSVCHSGMRARGFAFLGLFRVLRVGGVFAGSFRLGLYRFLGFVRLGRNVGLGDFFSLGCSRFLLGRRFLARYSRDLLDGGSGLSCRFGCCCGFACQTLGFALQATFFPWVVEGTAGRVGRHRRDGRGRLLGGCGLARGCCFDGHRGGNFFGRFRCRLHGALGVFAAFHAFAGEGSFFSGLRDQQGALVGFVRTTLTVTGASMSAVSPVLASLSASWVSTASLVDASVSSLAVVSPAASLVVAGACSTFASTASLATAIPAAAAAATVFSGAAALSVASLPSSSPLTSRWRSRRLLRRRWPRERRRGRSPSVSSCSSCSRLSSFGNASASRAAASRAWRSSRGWRSSRAGRSARSSRPSRGWRSSRAGRSARSSRRRSLRSSRPSRPSRGWRSSRGVRSARSSRPSRGWRSSRAGRSARSSRRRSLRSSRFGRSARSSRG